MNSYLTRKDAYAAPALRHASPVVCRITGATLLAICVAPTGFALSALSQSEVAPAAHTQTESAPQGNSTYNIILPQGSPRDGYALIRRQVVLMAGTADDAAHVRELANSLSQDSLWFRRGKTAFLVKDPNLLGRAQEVLIEAQLLGNRQAEVGEHQSKIGESQSRLAELGHEIQGSEASLKQTKAQLRKAQAQLASQQATLGDQEAQLADRQASDWQKAFSKLEGIASDALRRGLAEPVTTRESK